MKLKYLACSLGLLFYVVLGGIYGPARAREICETSEGVQFCVEMKGLCDLNHLLPREKNNIKMDLFHIAILNHSNQSIKIIPEYFVGVTAEGRIVAMDPPFYESIELKTKLRTRNIEPQQQIDGFLFFPATSGLIRTLVYSGNPFIEMLLY